MKPFLKAHLIGLALVLISFASIGAKTMDTLKEKGKTGINQLSLTSLKTTDPELVEFFDNFAADEVLQHVNLDKKTQQIVILAALIGSQSVRKYEEIVANALKAGVTPVEIKEIVYQSIAYVGMGKAYDFIFVTNKVFKKEGIKLPLKGQSTTTPETRHKKGLAVQKAIFGEIIDKMYKNSPPDQLHIQKFLSGNCFGDYYTREGLDIKMRELITFSMLLSMGGCEPQLKGHITGNLNVGNDKQTMLSAITLLIPYVGYPRALNAIKSLNEITGN